MIHFIQGLTEKILAGEDIEFIEAKALLKLEKQELFYLFTASNHIRSFFRGQRVSLCAITNAKSGNCPEDCKFCAQSSRQKTEVSVYPLITPDEMLRRAEAAASSGVHRFCLVTSGCSLDEQELESICLGISRIKNRFPKLKLDASLGKIDLPRAIRLRDAGLNRYNHNLETTPDFFSRICTTHKYEDRIKTISILKEAGLEVCCGGIFGMGEDQIQRIEFGFILKDLNVDSIAVNFLNPISGTALTEVSAMKPLEILKIVAILRFIMPDKEIRICGGRQKNLRGLQALLFSSGADATLIGDYLTTKGGSAQEDIQMLEDLGLSIQDSNGRL